MSGQPSDGRTPAAKRLYEQLSAATPFAHHRVSALDNDDVHGNDARERAAQERQAFLNAMAGRQITPRSAGPGVRRELMSPVELRLQIDAMREFEASAEQQRAAHSLLAA
jgi:hypothetical protein